MEIPKESHYYKAYIMGYRDGVRDARGGKDLEDLENDLMKLPVEAMELTTSACNCLARTGCKTVADVAALDDYALITMRRLGTKTAAEIACWLDSHGIRHSAWCKYL